jgi:hypothetical protein
MSSDPATRLRARRGSARWWALVVYHNAIVHPLLPFAEVLDVLPSRRARALAARMFEEHDRSFPEGAG